MGVTANLPEIDETGPFGPLFQQAVSLRGCRKFWRDQYFSRRFEYGV